MTTYSGPEDYAKRNPLGGVASVFDSIAERLRAGEDYAATLADYGLQEAHAAPVGDDAELALRLHDLTAPEYIDGHPWASEHDRVLLEAAERITALARENAALRVEADWQRTIADDFRIECNAKLAAAERCIRAADAMRTWFEPRSDIDELIVYDAARAALAPPAAEGET